MPLDHSRTRVSRLSKVEAILSFLSGGRHFPKTVTILSRCNKALALTITYDGLQLIEVVLTQS